MRFALFPALVFSSMSLAAAQVPVFELEALLAPGGQNGDRLGDQIDLDGARFCAGQPSRDDALVNAGAVLTWPRTGATLGAPAVLTSPMPRTAGQFGLSIALDGDELVVGELSSPMFGAPNRGAVHRFEDQGGAWVYVDSIPSVSPGSTARFGESTARDGELLVVGAPLEAFQFVATGAVHVYRSSGGTWQLEATLTASDGVTGDRFGQAVAVSGERIIVGAPSKRNGTQTEGAAYAFERTGGAWTETGRFSVQPASDDTGLGVSVDIDGVTAVVGAARTNDTGAAYVFEDSGAAWTPVTRLQPELLTGFATFGHDVRLDGDALIVGAYQESVVGFASGAAWVFERTGGAWTPSVRLVPESPGGFHGFGVALDGMGSFAVGAPVALAPGMNQSTGVVRFYRPERPIGANYCDSVPNSTQTGGRIAALGSDLVGDDQVVLVGYELPTNAFGFFLASQMQGLANQPGGSQGVLCLGGSIGRYVGPGQLKNTTTIGTFTLQLELDRTPTPTGLVPVTSGETWHFQAWHRDFNVGVPTSNFTDAVTIAFQ